MPSFSLKRLFALVALVASTCWLWKIMMLSPDSWKYPQEVKSILMLAFGASLGGTVGTPVSSTLKGAVIGALFTAVMLIWIWLFPAVY